MKLIIQKIFKEAIKSGEYQFRDEDLDSFKDAIIALEYGSVAGSVLINILLKLMEIKK